MNFHQKQTIVPDPPTRSLRYEPVTGRNDPGRNDTLERLAAMTTAPLLGSRWIFPRRFDLAFERLSKDPEAAEVIPEHAIWYFDQTLHLEVDPMKLEHRISDWVRDPHGVRWTGTSFLDAADWSAAISEIRLSPIHSEMHEIVAADGDIKDTRAYKNLLLAIELGRPSQRNNLRLRTVESVDAYLRYCRGLIKSMRKRGVMRHSVSGAFHGLRVKHWNARSPVHDSTERDVGVAITENGEIIRHLGGKHRTAIAQALKLPTLPVEIRLVHSGWLAKQVRRTGLPAHQALVEGVRELIEKNDGVSAAGA